VRADIRKEVRNTRRALKKKGLISIKDIDNDLSSTSSEESDPGLEAFNLENMDKVKRFTYAILGKPKNCL
tara:strand:+ start:205 stop:414 length:210 start_codon:yes stop_codon:yes gene_type:complete